MFDAEHRAHSLAAMPKTLPTLDEFLAALPADRCDHDDDPALSNPQSVPKLAPAMMSGHGSVAPSAQPANRDSNPVTNLSAAWMTCGTGKVAIRNICHGFASGVILD